MSALNYIDNREDKRKPKLPFAPSLLKVNDRINLKALFPYSEGYYMRAAIPHSRVWTPHTIADIINTAPEKRQERYKK